MTTEQMDQKDREARDIEALRETVEATTGTTGKVHLFEIRSDTEIPVFIEWMDNVLPGVEFDIPPANSVVIARNGTFDVYVHQQKDRPEAGLPDGYFDEARAHTRLQILQALEGDIERARAAEKWVFGE